MHGEAGARRAAERRPGGWRRRRPSLRERRLLPRRVAARAAVRVRQRDRRAQLRQRDAALSCFPGRFLIWHALALELLADRDAHAVEEALARLEAAVVELVQPEPRARSRARRRGGSPSRGSCARSPASVAMLHGAPHVEMPAIRLTFVSFGTRPLEAIVSLPPLGKSHAPRARGRACGQYLEHRRHVEPPRRVHEHDAVGQRRSPSALTTSRGCFAATSKYAPRSADVSVGENCSLYRLRRRAFVAASSRPLHRVGDRRRRSRRPCAHEQDLPLRLVRVGKRRREEESVELAADGAFARAVSRVDIPPSQKVGTRA